MEMLQPKNTIPLIYSSLYFKQIWNTVADIGIISRQYLDMYDLSKHKKKIKGGNDGVKMLNHVLCFFL